MKIGAILNSGWTANLVVLAAMMWIVTEKHRLPDEVEPATVHEVQLVWLDLQQVKKNTDRQLLDTAIDTIYDFWVSKCKGIAGPSIDSDMDAYYDEFLRIKGRDHNWRDNNGGDEQEVFVILRSKGDC